MIDRALSNFRYWLNSNILVSSDGIPIPQESFFYIVLWIDSEVVYRWGVAEQFGLRKSHLRNHWNLFGFFAYTQLFIYKKKSKFQPHRGKFQSKLFWYPHLHTAFFVFKIIYYSNCFNTPKLKSTKKIANCSKILTLTKLFQNPYINLTGNGLILWSYLNYRKRQLTNNILQVLPFPS